MKKPGDTIISINECFVGTNELFSVKCHDFTLESSNQVNEYSFCVVKIR